LPKFNPRKRPPAPIPTRHSPCIHAQRRNLAFNMNVSAAHEIAGNEQRGRSMDTTKRSMDTTKRIEGRCVMTKITKTLTALAAVVTLTVAAVAAPQSAEARGWRGHGGHGRYIAGGVIGGLAAGALIGAAVANGPYYGYGPGYYAPGPAYYGPPCYWTHQRVWDGYGWRFQRVQVCG
jgi:hypothetical protein